MPVDMTTLDTADPESSALGTAAPETDEDVGAPFGVPDSPGVPGGGRSRLRWWLLGLGAVALAVIGALAVVAVVGLRRQPPEDPYAHCDYVETTDPVTGERVKVADPELANTAAIGNVDDCVHSTARFRGHDWHSTTVEGVTGGTFGTSPTGEVFARNGAGRLVEISDIGPDPLVTPVTWLGGEPVPAVGEDAQITVFRDHTGTVHVLYESKGAGLVHVSRAEPTMHETLGYLDRPGLDRMETVTRDIPGPYKVEVLDPQPFPERSEAIVERSDGLHVFWTATTRDDPDRQGDDAPLQRILWTHVTPAGWSPPVVVRSPDPAARIPGIRTSSGTGRAARGLIAATTLGDAVHLFYADAHTAFTRISLAPGTFDWAGPHKGIPCPPLPPSVGIGCELDLPPTLRTTSWGGGILHGLHPDSPLVAATVADPDSLEGRPVVVVAGATVDQHLLVAVYEQGPGPADLVMIGDLGRVMASRLVPNRCLNEYDPPGPSQQGFLLEPCVITRNRVEGPFPSWTGFVHKDGPWGGISVLAGDGGLEVASGYGSYSGAGIGLLTVDRETLGDGFESDFLLEHHRGDLVGTGRPVGLVPAAGGGLAIVAIPRSDRDAVTGERTAKPLTITCTGCDR